MRVKLKGIASATATLSNGERANYFYAWRGGPRLVGEPGSPEFLADLDRGTCRGLHGSGA
jgi:hypothetical protein